jgi:hypothetical protein
MSLNDFKSSETVSGLLNAIRTQATSLEQEIDLFLSDIKRGLSCGSAKGFYHGICYKIKWAQYASAKIGRLDGSTAATSLSCRPYWEFRQCTEAFLLYQFRRPDWTLVPNVGPKTPPKLANHKHLNVNARQLSPLQTSLVLKIILRTFLGHQMTVFQCPRPTIMNAAADKDSTGDICTAATVDRAFQRPCFCLRTHFSVATIGPPNSRRAIDR